MELPLFFQEQLPTTSLFILTEETLKHVHVLRMQAGEQIKLTNGKGQSLTVEIKTINKKSIDVEVIATGNIFSPDKKLSIAISLIKNTNRFEWFLEKATEIGVTEIIPLICERTEKQHFRYDRMKNILVSAMLQSQQAWLPSLHEPIRFIEFVQTSSHQKKYIAHCIRDETRQSINQPTINQSTLICIGPEGDFTKGEIESAMQHNFIPVSLGNTRLRTETAGIVAAVLLRSND